MAEPQWWQDMVTLGLAGLGAVLGVMNTWQAMSRERLRLRVRPMQIVSGGGLSFGIEVVNLSSFPVTVEEVGFTLGVAL
jgi:hypothetical protein